MLGECVQITSGPRECLWPNDVPRARCPEMQRRLIAAASQVDVLCVMFWMERCGTQGTSEWQLISMKVVQSPYQKFQDEYEFSPQGYIHIFMR